MAESVAFAKQLMADLPSSVVSPPAKPPIVGKDALAAEGRRLNVALGVREPEKPSINSEAIAAAAKAAAEAVAQQQ